MHILIWAKVLFCIASCSLYSNVPAGDADRNVLAVLLLVVFEASSLSSFRA